MIDQLKPLIGKLTIFAKKRMGFQHPPKLFLRDDSDNSKKMLGKTAHYDPQAKAVTLFTHNRHPKDILRSYAHELVHHTQNLRGDLSSEKCGEMGQGYAQDNGHMRNMEKEAYLEGNMCFRDWEDTLNDKDNYIIMKIPDSKILKENKTMTKKITKEFLKETIRKIIAEQAPAMSAPAATGDEALAAHKAVIAQYKKGNPGVSKKDYQRAVAAVSAAGEEKPKARPAIPDFEKSQKGYQAFAQSALEEEVDELEEGGNAKTDKHDDNPKLKGGQKNLPDSLQKGIISSADSDSDSEEKKDESKIQTPEQETSLYESRFAERNNKLFENLTKKWTK